MEVVDEPMDGAVSIFDGLDVWKHTEQDFELRHLLRWLRTGKERLPIRWNVI